MGNRHRDGVHDTDQVDVRRVDELHRVGLSHGHRQDAGIGDDDVDPAEISNPRLDCVAQFMALANVGDPRNDTSAESP